MTKFKWETKHPASDDIGPLFDVWGSGSCLYAAGGLGMDGVLLRSRGGGAWEPVDFGESIAGLRGVWGRSADDLYVTGESGTVRHTSDGGKTWETQETPTSSCLYKIAGAPDGSIFITQDDGLLRSPDGKTWEEVELEDLYERLLCLWFGGNNIVVAAGGGGTVMRSEDGGKTFVEQSTGSSKALCGLWGPSPQELLAVGDGGTIIATRDGGESWQNVKSNTRQDLEDIACGAAGELYVVGNGGTILASGDNGQTWEAHESDTKSHLWAMWRDSSGAWVISADDGLIIGSSWFTGGGPKPIPYF